MKKLLIVDDDGGMRDLFKAALKAEYLVLVAADGLAALEVIKSEGPLVVFLDMNMPGLNGIETLKEIGKSCPGPEVWMLTGVLELEMAETALAAGARGYITKPFSMEAIRKVAEDAANRVDKKPDVKPWHRAP